jgi:hypothetical protein
VNWSKLARTLGKASVLARDVNAVQRGRVGQRLVNRVVGRQVNKLTKGLWR